MSFDPRVQLPGGIQPEDLTNTTSTRTAGTSSQNGSKTSAAGQAPASGEDTVSLSGKHAEVQSLTASFANVPAVRASRVSALQQQVRSNQYQPDSGKVADAIINEYSKVSPQA
jgi:flagellar biosynthesis anti-sigma factor FlgM